MFVKYLLPLLSVALFLNATGLCGETAPATKSDAGRAGDAEFIAATVLLPLMTRWEPEKIRELGRRLAELPDPVASHALWLITSAPARIDTSQFYAMALSSPSPVIRRQATDILASHGSADGMRLLMSLLVGERDPETIASIIAAIARQPERSAVPSLIAIILEPKVPPRVSTGVAEHLRRLTRADIGDSPTAWRDWWLDHSHAYE